MKYNTFYYHEFTIKNKQDLYDFIHGIVTAGFNPNNEGPYIAGCNLTEILEFITCLLPPQFDYSIDVITFRLHFTPFTPSNNDEFYYERLSFCVCNIEENFILLDY